jgi:hypothetical protein
MADRKNTDPPKNYARLIDLLSGERKINPLEVGRILRTLAESDDEERFIDLVGDYVVYLMRVPLDILSGKAEIPERSPFETRTITLTFVETLCSETDKIVNSERGGPEPRYTEQYFRKYFRDDA